MSSIHQNLAFAQGQPTATGLFRRSTDDFIVDEIAGFEPSGEGEHLLIEIRKRDANTQWVARQLADFAQINPRDVGYCGLKDRRALTTQWFSLYLPKKDQLDWSAWSLPGVEVLQQARHLRKLRPGMNRGNRFQIRLHQLDADHADLEARLASAQREGVPNYFGEQRFGHQEGNIDMAKKMLTGQIQVRDRKKRGLYLSAARSLIFNLLLSQRVEQNCWNRPIEGDLYVDALGALVNVEDNPAILADKLKSLEWHPSGPLWGRGRTTSSGMAAEIETRIAVEQEGLCHGLEHVGLKQERRSLRLVGQDLKWNFDDKSTLSLSFSLVSGTYATSFLREILAYETCSG